MERYIKITPENRKSLVTLGRIIWVIRSNDLCGFFDIRPALKKGCYLVQKGVPPATDGSSTYCFEDEMDYVEKFKSTLDRGIEEGILYIKNGEPKATYKYEKTR